MTRIPRVVQLLWLPLLAALLPVPSALGQSTPAAYAVNAMPRSQACDRACLYTVLDRYLSALTHKDPWQAPWAQVVHVTENNVPMAVGQGLWGTLTSLGSYQLKLADPDSGQVAWFGAANENGNVSPIVVRLKIEDSRITEAEMLVRRKADDANFMADPVFEDKPVMNEMLPPASQLRRERLISIADGYFDTLQLNDGTLFTQFDDQCNRVENGVRTTNNPAMEKISRIMVLGCAEQFRLGNFRYDDRLRARRFPLVDVERGLVLGGAFMDHDGRLGAYTLTDGRPAQSNYRRPHSYYLLELFKVTGEGKIRQIEAVFMSVPYRTHSAWTQD